MAGGIGVLIDANGRLGTTTSSARFKQNISQWTRQAKQFLALKPVTFRYKKELDPESIPQFGLVAEEVAQIDPDLVVKDDQGNPYTVRYEAVNAMLLNEFLKEYRTAQQQEEEIAALRAKLKDEVFIKKVNDRVELNKAAAL